MTVPMVGWMVHRGHGWRANAEMSASMFIPTFAVIGLLSAELLTDVTGRWFFNPNLEVVLVDDGTLATLNGDVHYDIPATGDLTFWLGGGPAVIFQEIDPPRNCRNCEGVDETDFGLNLLAGVGIERGGLRPYAQAKAAHRYFVDSGRGWGPWSCKPS